MPSTVSIDDLLAFLTHAGNKGLMPVATTQALAVAVRNVLAVLDDTERAAVPIDGLDAIVRRFETRRARDFNPSSLREYGRRTRRAVDLFTQWRNDPATFSAPTRNTARRGAGTTTGSVAVEAQPPSRDDDLPSGRPTTTPAPTREAQYTTHFPVRPGIVITIADIPFDLTATEAERLAAFVRLLAPE